MEQEAAQELLDIQSHEPLLVAVGRITPAEGDVAFESSTSLEFEMATR